jgi:Na+/H+-dicarboxylate symporter
MLVDNIKKKTILDLYNWDVDEEIVQGTNILGLVVVAVVVGIALAQLGEETRTIANFFHNLMALSMKITTWIIKLSPVGILFLVTAKIMEMEDMGMVLGQLGLYFATVMVGLLVQGFIVLPLIYLLLTRKSPIPYIINMSQAIATAFGTASRYVPLMYYFLICCLNKAVNAFILNALINKPLTHPKYRYFFQLVTHCWQQIYCGILCY